jgi:RIO kinase 1
MAKKQSSSKKKGKQKEGKQEEFEIDDSPIIDYEAEGDFVDRNYRKADDLQKSRIDYKKEKTKDSDDLKVAESVLDKETRSTLFSLIRRNIIKTMTSVISTGKEANVYHAYAPDDSELAIKVYRTSTNIFKGLQVYILGDPRFAKIKRDQRSFVYAWAKKEFKNLKRAHEAGVAVPKPIFCLKDVVVMEFIGENTLPHRIMKDTIPENPQVTYEEVWENIDKLYNKARLVHADLSEYNMLYTPKVVFIDISQAVLLEHNFAEVFLYRDLKNIHRYFTSLGAEVPEVDTLFEELVEEPPSDKIKTYRI